MEVIISFAMLNKDTNRSPITIIINDMTMVIYIINDTILQVGSVYGHYIALHFESNIECRRGYEFVLRCIKEKTFSPYKFYEEDVDVEKSSFFEEIIL